jgi:hypothetical protein
MTTLFLRLGSLRPKNTFLLFGMLLLGNGVYAQLDSAAVSSISFTQEIVTDSATNVTDTIDVMNVDVYTNDIDFLGEVVITVYETSTDFPLSKRKLSKQEALLVGAITGNNVLVSLDGFVSNESYRIEVLVRNYQDANLSLVIYNHN